MAGIGFELKKLFSKEGIFSLLKAYGYAGVISAGPMLLGVVLLLGITTLANIAGASSKERDLLICMITYALLASLFINTIFSMVTTRYVSDKIYREELEFIMPSFYGSIGIMLTLGGVLYGIFLIFSGVDTVYKVLSLLLFFELIVVWTEINYLTAIKDYKGILLAFFFSLVIAFVLGYILTSVKLPIILSLFFSVTVGYGVMMVWYLYLLLQYFPRGKGSSFSFLRWFDYYPEISYVGSFLNTGMFGHILIMWFGPLGVRVQGLFFSAPGYDVPALFAFMSILITTINFMATVEVNFYPKYRNYFSLLNDRGSLKDIEEAELEMLGTLEHELSYAALKQFFTTIIFIVLGGLFLLKLDIGFTEDMLATYRLLCVGYAFYAIGNTIMLIQLYFSDNKGAFISTLFFSVTSILFTLCQLYFLNGYYGIGFLAGSAVFYFIAWLVLKSYTNKLEYHILSEQNIIVMEKNGLFTKLCNYLESRDFVV